MRNVRRCALVVILGLFGLANALAPATDVAASGIHPIIDAAQTFTDAPKCPWVGESLHHLESPAALTGQVLARMTLSQKAGLVTLSGGHGIENFNRGVTSLCIPPLTLSDGPDGVAGGVSGVTQLPAAIGLGASFDPSLAFAAGQVVGSEARTKGINVVQGPDLNLARVPFSGRVYESYGEDPFLTSVLGVANIEGIQSEGVMAMAKHFVGYTQETARARLEQFVTPRALAELYDAPFEAAVKLAHVASVMCATGLLNGKPDCADPYIYSTLKSWGFKGFVRSDEGAANNLVQAFGDGLDVIKPASAATVVKLVRAGTLPMNVLNRAARSVLTQMFAYGLIALPRMTAIEEVATTPSHASVALQVAEESIVLLRNVHDALPLSSKATSVAVIGVDAATDPLTTGLGSSQVVAPFVVTPLTALQTDLGPHARVVYASGAPNSLNVGPLRRVGIMRNPSTSVEKKTGTTVEFYNEVLLVKRASDVTKSVITATKPGEGEGWSSWHADLRVRKTGLYEVSVRQIGDTWFYLNGRQILASPGLHVSTDMTTVVKLRTGHSYTFGARWFSVVHQGPPQLGVLDVSPQIEAAVAKARKAKVAIVFVGEESTEGADQTSLSLPGDENALIEAVAAANKHTIVVLNTGGPVTMPWLNDVQAVLEAWYPGEEDGRAIAAVLTGAVDPSGRLPITFPSSASAQPVSLPSQFPGVNDAVRYGAGSAGLDVGYRWYQAHYVRPLFPFGFGLDYTTFGLTDPSIVDSGSRVTIRLTVTNTGSRSGADVVQAYVKYPSSVGEPPEQLRAFARVVLDPSSSRQISLVIPLTSFQSYAHGVFRTMPGYYQVSVGSSSSNLPLHLSVKLS